MITGVPLVLSVSIFLSLATKAQAWTTESTFTVETGDRLSYVIAAPQDPQALKTKLPLLIYEQGDGTTNVVINNTFAPAQIAGQMELASRASGFLWAVPELRTQYFSGQALKICSLDFSHRERDLEAFIDQVKQLSFVDSNRIFLMGHSAGADTVTRVALNRPDIRGTINIAGGVSSCSEESADCPANLQSLLQYQCSAQEDMGRTGPWWRQLFLESNLFESISSIKTPYLALIGDRDQVVSLLEFQNYSAQISKMRSGFESTVLPGFDHAGIVTAPQTLQLVVKFITENL